MKRSPSPRLKGAPKAVVKVSPEDHHISMRIKERRFQLRLPLSYLAEQLGISTQQISKYELGTDRITAARLFHVAIALDTPVEWFYEGLSRLGIKPDTPKEEPELLQHPQT